jgi:glucose-6-phosphate 1-dehydrogenase
MERPDDLILIIFGATGDLTSRKLIPAIYSLKEQNLLPDRFALIGVGRTEITSETFRNIMTEAILKYSEEEIMNREKIPEFTKCFEYQRFVYDSLASYEELAVMITGMSKKLVLGDNLIFYMATPPNLYDSHQPVLCRSDNAD